ncbi:MAG: glycosyltransferase family 4 protein [Bacteroidales bacterium]|nr:glycosyltransferase family 4 protein [Bacteroidales bacterium]
MKVLYFSTSFFMDLDLELLKSLAGKVELTYICDLHKNSYQSTILHLEKELPEGIFAFSEVSEYLPSFFHEYIDYSKSFFQHRKKTSLFGKFMQAVSIVKFALRTKPDIIHFGGNISLPHIGLLFMRTPRIQTIHDPTFHSGEFKRKKHYLKKLVIRKANKILLLNHMNDSQFMETFRLKKEKLIHSSLGIYDVYTNYSSNTVEPIPQSILFFGRISPYKGINYLCDAAVRLKKEIPGLQVWILGKGNYWFDTKHYRNAGITFINRFIPNEEMVKYIQSSEIIACPYTDATQSGVIMTALAFRKAIIATNVGAIPEVIEHEKTGLLVNPKQADELYHGLKRLLTEPDLREKLYQNIEKEYFSGEKSWNSLSDKLICEYDRTINYQKS